MALKYKFFTFISIFVLIPGIFIFQSCSEVSLTNQPVTIGYCSLRISLPVFTAVEKGYFEDEGLDVKLVRFDTAQPLMNSLVAGVIDVGGYTALPITYNAMIQSGRELYFITALVEDQQHRLSYFIISNNAGNDFAISDLKGGKIGVLPTVAYKKWLEVVLENSGLDSEEVTILPVQQTMQPSALASGQVDALFTNDPAASTILQKGIGRLLSGEVEMPKYLGTPFIFGSFNLARDFADEHPEITRKVIRALDRGVTFVNRNPGPAKQIMKNFIHESQKPFVDDYPDALYQPSTEVKPRSFQDLADKYLQLKIIRTPIDVAPLVIREDFCN